MGPTDTPDTTPEVYAPAGLCRYGAEDHAGTGECPAPATHKVTGPGGFDPDHRYCEAHAREVWERSLASNPRWSVVALPGVSEAIALRARLDALDGAVREYIDAVRSLDDTGDRGAVAMRAFMRLVTAVGGPEVLKPRELLPIVEATPWRLGNLIAHCIAFDPRGARPSGGGDCPGDGHYQCRECVHYDPGSRG